MRPKYSLYLTSFYQLLSLCTFRIQNPSCWCQCRIFPSQFATPDSDDRDCEDKRSTYLVVGSKEATDPTALPAGVSHEQTSPGTHPQPRPLGTTRMLVMTTRLHPATGPRTGPLHEVEHVPAGYSPVPEVSVQATGLSRPPNTTEVRLVLRSPGIA